MIIVDIDGYVKGDLMRKDAMFDFSVPTVQDLRLRGLGDYGGIDLGALGVRPRGHGRFGALDVLAGLLAGLRACRFLRRRFRGVSGFLWPSGPLTPTLLDGTVYMPHS